MENFDLSDLVQVAIYLMVMLVFVVGIIVSGNSENKNATSTPQAQQCIIVTPVNK